MSLSRRINRRRATALYAGLAKFEVDARSDSDPGRSAERMRILGKVREFALHVGETDLDKAWAYLQESRREYKADKDGLSALMCAVDDWEALDELAKPPPDGWARLCSTCRDGLGLARSEECTKGHGERPCEKCGTPFVGQCISRDLYEKAKEQSNEIQAQKYQVCEPADQAVGAAEDAERND